MKERKKVLNHITSFRAAVDYPAVLSGPQFFPKLDSLYSTSATKLPRYEVFRAFYSEALHWWYKYNPSACTEFAVKALEALGFVMDSFRGVTPRERKNGIMVQQQWGASLPEVAELW